MLLSRALPALAFGLDDQALSSPAQTATAALTMATLVEQVQVQSNPVLEAMYAQSASVMTVQTPEKMRATSARTTTHKQIENRKDVNADCNCFERDTVDYRSFVRKPEFIINMGSFTIRNPLHMTIEQDKSNLKSKVKRAKKTAQKAHKDARKANKAAQKARAKSDKIHDNAVATRMHISAAQQMATDAWAGIDRADAAHARAMKWAAFVEREGENVGDVARGVRARAQYAGDKTQYCDHRFR